MFRAFKDDLPVWHAALARDLSIRFEEPSVGMSRVLLNF
jgi:hypothetical protein